MVEGFDEDSRCWSIVGLSKFGTTQLIGEQAINASPIL